MLGKGHAAFSGALTGGEHNETRTLFQFPNALHKIGPASTFFCFEIKIGLQFLQGSVANHVENIETIAQSSGNLV